MSTRHINITREQFVEFVGRSPEDDDLERCNCTKAGRAGHISCGWCKKCNKPQFICRCRFKKKYKITD